MDFSSGSANKSGLNPNERAALMSNLKQQLEIAQAQELLEQISDKCFKMCVQRPGSSLSSSEQVI
jgi:import inner membrane translocase subunit TIM13